MTDLIEVVRHYNGRYTATQTPTNGVSVKGFHKVEAVVNVGTIANIASSPQPSWSFALQHSDSQSSGFTAVAAEDVVMPNDVALGANGVFAVVDAAPEDDRAYRVGYIGGKEFVRIVATAAGTPGNSDIDAFFIVEKMLNAHV